MGAIVGAGGVKPLPQLTSPSKAAIPSERSATARTLEPIGSDPGSLSPTAAVSARRTYDEPMRTHELGRRWTAIAAAAIATASGTRAVVSTRAAVTLVRVPHGGIQPEAAVDAR